MEKIQIDLGEKAYPIDIGNGLLQDLEQYIGTADQWAILTDENLDGLYDVQLQKSLGNKIVHKVVLIPGEESKNIHTVMEIIDYLYQVGFTRNSKILAFGGGVVGDIAGFCASIYMRGIGYIQIPTTLLAQVDSSVGGKTGINIPQGKNIIGTFYQPQKVIIDVDLLGTLPRRELISGLGEVVKYGIIYDYAFFQYLCKNMKAALDLKQECLTHIIKSCCEIKSMIVSQDERETGLRKILNFGHTVAHALEAETGYTKYTHGEAVWLGMYHETLLAKKLDVIESSYFDEILSFFQGIEMSFDISAFDKEVLIHRMAGDKKNRDGKISFILPTERGKVTEALLAKDEIRW